MSKICPITNKKVVYLTCLECDDKVCKNLKDNFTAQADQFKNNVHPKEGTINEKCKSDRVGD